ncbi:MAG: TrkH family potassium uptake protein [Candidatus Altiarchaeota archaeon]|nr:TrkH family potassium uptake protein [Candidatus Altiarchaeota archaeon]
MDLKDISWYLGVFLFFSGALSLLPIPVALYYNEPILLLLMRSLVFWFLGALCLRRPRMDIDFRHAMLLVALSLLVIPFIGAIPFFFVFDEPFEALVNGYFESVSGYTTSGLTVFPTYLLNNDSPFYSRSLIFSRALMEWTGGLGVVILFLSLLARGGISTVFLYRVEGGEKIVPSIDHTAKIILRIYLFYTFSGTAILILLDMGLLEALSTMMSILSTGGFIFLVEGIHISLFSEIVILLFLILAAVPFTLDYILLSGDLKRFFSHLEIRFGCWLIFLAILSFTLISLTSGIDLLSSLHRNITLVISSITTGGPGQDILDDLHAPELFLVIVLMLIGGGAGSTAGGLKVIRVGVLFEAVRWFIKKLSLPESAVFPFKVGKSVFSDEELRNIALFFFIYVLLIFVGTFSLMLWGMGEEGNMRLFDAFFLSVSAQSNVGFSTVDVSLQPLVVKLVLIFQMIAGRLEIFPVLALVGYLLEGFGRDVAVIEHEMVEVKKELVGGRKKGEIGGIGEK